MRDIGEADSIEALRLMAYRRVPRAVYDFIDGGAEDEITLRRNQDDLTRVTLVPHQLRDVSKRNLSTSILGRHAALPLIVAPTGLAALCWPRADVALAKAAGACEVPFVISTPASVRLEDIAAAATNTRLWFQLYFYRDRVLVKRLVERAARAGVEALVLTVDTPVLGWRRRDHHNRFRVPLKPSLALARDILRCPAWTWGILRHGIPRLQNFAEAGKSNDVASLAQLSAGNLDASVTWDDLRWLRDLWSGKLVLKGILCPDDAEIAVRHGLDGVWVSNHGGRQLDGAPSTISVLPDIARAAGSKLEIYMDSGVRKGADMAKAIAFGARAAAVGRATLYSVAAGGEVGTRQALNILSTEYDRCLALLGCASTKDLGSAYVRGEASATFISGRIAQYI